MNRITVWYRWALAGIVAGSWVVLAVMMWRAFHTLPSAEQLADAREVRPPLPADLLLNMGKSLVVAVLLIGVLWPGRGRYYLLRAGIAFLALVAWFLMTVPLSLNNMEWLHRRWLAFMVVLQLFTLLTYPVLTLYRGGFAQQRGGIGAV